MALASMEALVLESPRAHSVPDDLQWGGAASSGGEQYSDDEDDEAVDYDIGAADHLGQLAKEGTKRAKEQMEKVRSAFFCQ